MVLLGQLLILCKFTIQHRSLMGSAGTQTAALAFRWFFCLLALLVATEEWTGAGAPLTQTITVS
jgi:hypothetical protein